jgi:hypothetical protein
MIVSSIIVVIFFATIITVVNVCVHVIGYMTDKLGVKMKHKVKVRFTVELEYEGSWDKETVCSWVENKCWEALVEHGDDEIEVGEGKAVIVKGKET